LLDLFLELHSAFNIKQFATRENFSTRFNFAKKVQSFAREVCAFYWLLSLSLIAARRQASEIRSKISRVQAAAVQIF
jgi:hypothetical protein